VAPLLTVHLDFDKTLGIVFAVLTGVFNLDPNAFGRDSDDGGLCFLPGFTSVNRAAISFGVPLLLLGWTVLVAGAGFAWDQLRQRQAQPGTAEPGLSSRWRQGVIKATLLACNLSYSSLLKTTFALLSCVEVQGRGQRLLIAGGVTCFTSWQLGLIPVIIVLALAPVAFALWLSHLLKAHTIVGTAVEQRVALFSDEWYLWPAFTYFERLLLLLAHSFVPFRARSWVLFTVI